MFKLGHSAHFKNKSSSSAGPQLQMKSCQYTVRSETWYVHPPFLCRSSLEIKNNNNKSNRIQFKYTTKISSRLASPKCIGLMDVPTSENLQPVLQFRLAYLHNFNSTKHCAAPIYIAAKIHKNTEARLLFDTIALPEQGNLNNGFKKKIKENQNQRNWKQLLSSHKYPAW